MNIEDKNENKDIKNLFKRKSKTNQSNNVDNNDLKNSENNNLESNLQNDVDNLNSNQINEINDQNFLNDNNNFNQMNQINNLNRIEEDTNYSEINEYNYLKSPNNENKREDTLQIKSNLHKTRIIEAEINSGLFLQILIYYNIFSSLITFAFQIFTISFKVNILNTFIFE
jgi:hypothetical protein